MMRKSGLGSVFAAAVVVVTFVAGRARGDARFAPGHVELRLSPIVANGGSGINGIEIVAPQGGGTRTDFGLNVGIGVLATPYIEPGASLTVDVVSGAGTTTDVGMTPFLKINTWAAQHVNPFIEPFAGFLLHNPPGIAANSTTY